MPHRQQLQNESIDQGEVGGIGADPQRRRKDRHCGEQRRIPQAPAARTRVVWVFILAPAARLIAYRAVDRIEATAPARKDATNHPA